MNLQISISIFMILIFKLSVATSPTLIHHWMIWNVGQGQWITLIENSTCSHFDFGGEIFSLKENRQRFLVNCKNKENQFYLSHADFDHYSFYNFIIKNSITSCWQIRPTEPLKKINNEIPICSEATKLANVLHADSLIQKRNESSTVLQIEQILIPGDSPSQKEKLWVKNIPLKNEIKILILGHHGSQTSSSEILLSKLPLLKMAIASSRFKKYGHPHKKVLDRLKARHMNVIRTEDWGTIMIL